ncbi:MAG: ArdC-like ssDNA-binding domain-containing protein [Rhodobacterales bacterium]
MKIKRDIHQEVTDKIITAIEAGTAPWMKPWAGACGFEAPRRQTGEYYQGVNVLLLWMAADENGYFADQWMTFKQAKNLGANVRKGEKGTQVVYYSTFERDSKMIDAKGSAIKESIPFLKSYTVFNVQQIENLPEKYAAVLPENIDTGTRSIDELESFFNSVGVRVCIDGQSPKYRPLTDTVYMPFINQFKDAASYYAILAHETIHWTGHTSRLDRLKKYGNKEGRAFEELIAELGACFLSARIGNQYDNNRSANYIEGWLTALRSDKKYIFQAASKASKGVAYIIDAADQDSTQAIAA